MKVALAADPRAVLPLLELALPFNVDGEADLAELLDGAAVFAIEDDAGELVGAFALNVERRGPGQVVRCVAAGARPGANVLQAIVEFTEREARERIGAASIQCETRRPGLVHQLQREGFRIAGYILTKEVH